MAKYCSNCGAEVDENAVVCVHCGCALPGNGTNNNIITNANSKSKLVAALLALIFGGAGIHDFYLGNTTRGILHIVASLILGLGIIWGFVDAILILTGKINTDSQGNPLV